jgi:hypothetical protein
MKSSLSILVAASALALLSACGGGGDSSSNPSGGKVAITSANQSQVARATIASGLSVSLTQGSVGAAPASVATRAQALANVLQRAVAAARDQRKGIASASLHPTAATSDVVNCGVSGTVTTTFDDRDGNSVISSGDVITATFAQCKDSATLAINGAIAVTLTGTPTATQFTANADFQNIVVTDNGASATISGNVAVAENDMSTLSRTTLTVGNGGLSVATASSSYNDSVSYSAGFVIDTAVVAVGGGVTASLAGTMTAQSLGGSVTIATPLALVQSPADNYPSVGQIVITGASGSTVRATVLDNTQVKLELDANGDGSYESTSTVAWATLIP